MRNILRALLLGVVSGVLIGINLHERVHLHPEEEAYDELLNEVEAIRMRDLESRVLKPDEWVDEFEVVEP